MLFIAPPPTCRQVGYTPHRTGAGGRIAPQRVSRVVFRFIWHRKCVYCSFFIKNRVLKN